MITKWRAIRLTGWMLGILCGALVLPVAMATPAWLHVSAEVSRHSVRLVAVSGAPFDFTTYRPSETLFVADLSGVTASDSSTAQVLNSSVVSSYRLIPFSSKDGKAMVRLEVVLHEPLEPKVERSGANQLSLTFGAPEVTPVSKSTGTTVKTASAPIAGHDASVIDAVQISKSGEQTEVRIVGSGRLAYHVLRLSNPERLVLDFESTQIDSDQHTVPSSNAPVKNVRLGQYSANVARIVIDLDREVPYNINAAAGTVTVAFGVSPKTDRAENKPPVTPAPEQKVAEVKAPATTPPAPQTQAPVADLKKTDSNPPNDTDKQQPLQTSSPAGMLSLPPNLTQPSTGLASPTAQPQPPATTPTAPETQPSDNGNGVQGGAKPDGTPKYTGEPISVNLKDVDLHDFFRLIHEISGLNVVVDPNVKGTLTIVLDDVPWDQALEIVLHNNDLEKELDGNVLRIATKETIRKEYEQSVHLAKLQQEATDTVTTTRVLSYAKASDLRETLKKFLTSRGDILSDDRSNTLIIRDIPSVLPVIDNLIRQLDRKSQQVEIEARVVAANRSFSREIGTQLAFAAATPNGRNFFGGTGAVGTSPISRPGTPPPPPPPVISSGSSGSGSGGGTGVSMPLATNLGALSPTSGVSYAFAAKNFALDYIISAAEAKGIGKLLSRPKVITQNNQRAEVKQGTKIPVQTVINNTISVQYVDAVLRLEVTPQITAEGTVFMDVVVENTQIDPSIPRVNGIPALDTQEADTRVLLQDGATIMIGGIIVSSQRNDIQQVPLFGSIPLIGHLFRHTTVSTQSQELLFFLTPRILPS